MSAWNIETAVVPPELLALIDSGAIEAADAELHAAENAHQTALKAHEPGADRI